MTDFNVIRGRVNLSVCFGFGATNRGKFCAGEARSIQLDVPVEEKPAALGCWQKHQRSWVAGSASKNRNAATERLVSVAHIFPLF
jgi:hypothetical protein